MAQNDLFELGVWVPLANHNFRNFEQIIYFDDAVTSGDYFYVADRDGDPLDPRDANTVLVPGLELELGPNSSGQYEAVTISSIDVDGAKYKVAVTSNLIYDYAALDHITVLTAPLDWTPYKSAYVDTRRYERADPMPYGSGILKFNTGYSAKISRQSSASAQIHRLRQDGSIGTLLSGNGVHRIAAWGKASGDTGDCEIRLYDMRGNSISAGGLATLTFTDDTDWTLNQTTLTPDTDSLLPRVDILIGTVTQPTSFWVDNVTIEHAYGTSDAASGYYTFTEYYEQGSLRLLRYSKRTGFEYLNNNMGFNNPADGNHRRGFAVQYADVPQVFRDNLNILQDYCENGNHLVLRPNIDEFPDVMIVDLMITDDSKDIWDTAAGTFTVNFVQVR